MNSSQTPTDRFPSVPGYPPPNLEGFTGEPKPHTGVGYPPGSVGLPYPAGDFGPNVPGAYVPPQNALASSSGHGRGLPIQGGFAPPPGYGPQQGPQVVWMPRPKISHCPPGLEYLTQINQLLVKQKKELFEMFTGVETENVYVCMNTMGQTVYTCREESDFCMRQCCSSGRAFTMHIHDNMGVQVIRVNRPYKYHCACGFFNCAECCQDEVEVEAPVGHVIGYVKQVMAGCDIRYHILDKNRSTVLQIYGPSYCHCPCFGEDVHFRVTSADGAAEIGRITKQWSNILQEVFTDADNFGVSFPMDLDVHVKATLIGAVFLIDFMFFENNNRRRNTY